jgi:hypothetical protein
METKQSHYLKEVKNANLILYWNALGN